MSGSKAGPTLWAGKYRRRPEIQRGFHGGNKRRILFESGDGCGLEANTKYAYRLVNGESRPKSISLRPTATETSLLLSATRCSVRGGDLSSDESGWAGSARRMAQKRRLSILLSAGDQVESA
jgi:hypothetical protein